MKHRFILNPTEEDIKEIGEAFCLRDAVVALDASDVQEVLENAENAIVLYGKASGANRCADAIEDAVLHCCAVAKDYDLFTSDNLLLQIDCPKSAPMLMREFEAIETFTEMFHQNITSKFGFAEKENLTEMRVMLLAANLKKKQ